MSGLALKQITEIERPNANSSSTSQRFAEQHQEHPKIPERRGAEEPDGAHRIPAQPAPIY